MVQSMKSSKYRSEKPPQYTYSKGQSKGQHISPSSRKVAGSRVWTATQWYCTEWHNEFCHENDSVEFDKRTRRGSTSKVHPVHWRSLGKSPLWIDEGFDISPLLDLRFSRLRIFSKRWERKFILHECQRKSGRLGVLFPVSQYAWVCI
jgi:hypothetical protein